MVFSVVAFVHVHVHFTPVATVVSSVIVIVNVCFHAALVATMLFKVAVVKVCISHDLCCNCYCFPFLPYDGSLFFFDDGQLPQQLIFISDLFHVVTSLSCPCSFKLMLSNMLRT